MRGHAKSNQGIRGSCCEGQRRAQHSSRGGAGGPETSPEGQQLRRPCSPSSACHPNSGLRPVREGHRRLSVQHQEDPQGACAHARTGASDIERLEYRIPVPNECVAYDGKECIRPVRAKHTDWCGLASIVQAIVETFPKNCALMFPPLPPPSVALFSTTFRPQSSDDADDDDADNYGTGSSFRRFDSSLSAPARGDLTRTGRPYTSTPLLHGGAFRLSTDPKEPPSSSLSVAPIDDEEHGSQLGDDNLDMGQEANDKGDGEKDPAGDETLPNPSKLELLQEIIDPAAHNQLPPVSKSGDKRGPSHLDGGSVLSDSSVEDLDAKGACPKKKGSTPTKASGSHPSQWTDEDICRRWKGGVFYFC